MNDLPLLELFNKLRDAGIPLGIGEYQLVLQALQAGFGISCRSELSRLCCTLWIKSNEEKKLFNYYFNQIIPKEYFFGIPKSDFFRSSDEVGTLEIKQQSKLSQKFSRLKRYLVIGRVFVLLGTLILATKLLYPFIIQSPQTLAPPSPPSPSLPQASLITALTIFGTLVIPLFFLYALFLFSLSKADRWIERRKNKYRIAYIVISRTPQINPSQVSLFPSLIREFSDEIQLVKAVRQFNSDIGNNLNSLAAYIPVTRRQMKQSWRYLRCLVREGVPAELDLEATVNQIGRKGFLLNPVLIPRRVNRVQVLLLIDQGGSMIPFHTLAQRFVETAVQGGRLGKIGVYYFHNCPLDYLYRDTTRLEAEVVDIILSQLSQSQTVAVIFSDAGAIRGGFNTDRYQLTKKFIEHLRRKVRYVVWLNPMPKVRWLDNTAGAIAQIIPMFEANRQGLDSAIDILRGRYSSPNETNK